MKTCFRCKVSQPVTSFYRHKRHGVDTYDGVCKKCFRTKNYTELKICPRCQSKFLGRTGMDQIFCGKACACGASVSDRMVISNIDDKIKSAARQKTRDFVDMNPEVKPSQCSCCGLTGRIVAHHDDYSQWNKVKWLCEACHMRLHQGGCVEVSEVLL